MKNNTLYYLTASALSVLVFCFITIPTYKHLFKKTDDSKPIPERSVMIQKGTGVSPIMWSENTPKETVHNGNVLSDTLTSRETIYLYPTIPHGKQGILEVFVLSDSLSGATSGTAYLDRNPDGIGWYYSEIFRINGAMDQQFKIIEEVSGEKIRLRFVANSSAQSTKIKAAVMFKPS